MGSCENSVIVEEPVPVPISGQHLFSEFALQSVLEQQPCSEHSHPEINSCSDLVRASEAHGCGGSNSGSSYLTAGGIIQMPEDFGTLASEENDSVPSGGCLDEDQMSGGECLQEGGLESEDGSGNSVGDCGLVSEDVPVASLASGDENNCDFDACATERAEECLQENGIEKPTGKCELPLEAVPMTDLGITGCLSKSQSGMDACETKRAGECLEESRSEGEGGIINLIESSELPLGGLVDGDCLSENHRDIDACHVERAGDCLQEGGEEGESGLVNSIGDCESVASLVSKCCLNENNSDIDPCKAEGSWELLQENGLQAEDDARKPKPTGNCELPIEVIPMASFSEAGCSKENQLDTSSKEFVKESRLDCGEMISVADLANEDCLNENHTDLDASGIERAGDFLQEGWPDGEGCSGNLIGDCGLPLEVITVGGLASERCTNENPREIDGCSKKLTGECLLESRSQVKEGVEDMTEDCKSEVIPGLTSGGGLDEIKSNVDACSEERSGECLPESEPQLGYGLRNITGDCDLSIEVIPAVGFSMNAIQQDEQKDDESFDCLPADIKEILEEKSDDALAIVKSNFFEQEPPLQNRESSEMASLTDGHDHIHEVKEQDFKSVDGSSVENISGKTVASAELKADPCKHLASLQPCEMTLVIAHSGESITNCDRKIDQKNCTVCLSKETIMEAIGVKREINTSNQVSPSRSLGNASKFESPAICVQECDQNRSVYTLAKCGTESFVENNDVGRDIKVEVCNLEENVCNDEAVPPQSDGCLKRSDAPNQVDNSSQEPLKSASAIDCCGQTDNQGKVIVGVKCETVSSSSQRNGGKSRSRRKTGTKQVAGKGKKTAKASCSHERINIAFFKVTKKRSSLPKLARTSDWGLLGSVTQLFERINGLEAIQVSNKGSQKSKGRKNNGKKNKNGTTARARGSKKSQASNTTLRLKVKIGKGVHQSMATVPELVNASAPCTLTSCDGTELQKESPEFDNSKVDDREKGEVSIFPSCFGNIASGQELQLIYNDLDSSLVIEKSAEDSRDGYYGMSCVLVDASGGATENMCKDPGTSPDSEVINSDAHTGSRSHNYFHSIVTSHENPSAFGGLTSNKRGNKKNKLSGSGSSKDKPRPVKTNRAKPLKQYGGKQNRKNGIHAGENPDSSASANASSNSSSDKEPSIVEPSILADENAPKLSMETLKEETGSEAAKMDCDPHTGVGLSKPDNSKKSKAKGYKLPKGKPQDSDSGIKIVSARCKGEPKQRSVSKKKITKKCLGDHAANNVESLPDTENHMVDAGREKNNSDDKIAPTNLPTLDLLPSALGEQYMPPSNAWVRCDVCHKWRRIPTVLADLIEETKCTWTCKDNVDKAFADCSTPQEKSNADINAELEISDASGEEDAAGTRLTGKGLECRRPRGMQEPVTCTTIRTNQFLHRNRKTHNIDEIMVCHCKPPSDGRLGCRDDCLNRMLNIECVQGACPCGELCSNQQFQKRKYANLGKFQCGKKGYGLKLLQDVSKGKFLIEYVGEVLDMPAYEARQKEYALKGHKHFYFMTLNGSEVIDACVKGNKGRFINHSCEPNCQTEKWMVNGEICIGLFALRDMKKGEEVTFDYNYVRVFGAAAKKCYCLSQHCRGYIGGDPLNGDVIIQSDSDEDYAEPLMLHQNSRSGERNGASRGARSSTDILKQTVKSELDYRDENGKGPLALGQPENSTGKEDSIIDSVSAVSSVHDALEANLQEKVPASVQPSEISEETEDSMSELVSTVQKESSLAEETPVKEELCKSLPGGANANKKPKSDNAHDKKLSSKDHAEVKIPRSSIKKAKVKTSPPNLSKFQLEAVKPEVSLIKPKKVVDHFEAVEEKLNKLLESDGGISKRKDATRGYLKLLLLTSALGGTANAIQRNRDLSMILDALLKTRSRGVLDDIINRNGLRMLHKLINQYRRDFNKTPILRKLLKVLEYLAGKDILTLEHIKEGPPHKGMESFRESLLSLTEHKDKQVHQIARHFRDRWIPKYLRRQCYMDRDDNKTELSRSSNYKRYSPTQNNETDRAGKSSEATDYVKKSEPATLSVDTVSQEGTSASCVIAVSQSSGTTRTRKRKSRWDQPAETKPDLSSLQYMEQKTEHGQFESNLALPGSAELSLENKVKFNGVDNNGVGFVNVSCHMDKAKTGHDEAKDVLDGAPPGFSYPLKPSPDSSVTPSTIFHSNRPLDNVVGHPQEKFISRLPISYGIPLSIIQQFGTPHEETAGSWAIAPGMAFQPFPPLPPFPRDKLNDPPPSGASSHSSVNQLAEEAARDTCLPATTNSNDCSPSTTCDQPVVQIPSITNQISSKRGREASFDLGTRYFKQQKWNVTKLRPPWHWNRKSWGSGGDPPRGETNNVSVGNVTNEVRSTTNCSEDLSYQQPEDHTQH